jgi:protein arginine kinase
MVAQGRRAMIRTIDRLPSAPVRWLEESGHRSDVALSTRVRLARNLPGCPFPGRATEAELGKVREDVVSAAGSSGYFARALVVRMEEAGVAAREVLVERHIVSRDFARRPEGRAVLIDEGEVVSAMVNEEDHVRLQCIRPGLAPLAALRLATRVDREMDRNLHYAFSGDWGYLTACPTNVGTGLRVSVLMHLAGLVREGKIAQVLGSISRLGLAVRGYYGEGSSPLGGFFQISNQTTLGQSEDDLAYTVERVGGQIAELETAARERLLSRRARQLEDEVHRARGILANARLLSVDEVMEHCSSLRLGVALGLMDDLDMSTVNRLLVITRPGHLAHVFFGEDPSEVGDAARADLVRRELAVSDSG